MRAEAALQSGFRADSSLPYYQQKPSDDVDQINLERIFPQAFTMTSSLLFLVPMWILISVGIMPGVAYFLSNTFWISLAIPPGMVVAHFALHWKLVPPKWVVSTMLIASSVLLLWIAEAMYVGAVDKTVKLASSDCSSFPMKRQLQMSWEAAYSLYDKCLTETAEKTGYSTAELMATFRIQDCEEYNAALTGMTKEGMRTNAKSYEKDWTYLRHLEETEMCSGWCYEGVQMWASTSHKDSCSSTVSNLLNSYVAAYSSQVAIVMLASLGTFVVLLILLGPLLRRCTGGNW